MKTLLVHICIALCFPLLGSCASLFYSGYAANEYNAKVRVLADGKRISVSPRSAKRAVNLWRILKDYPDAEIVLGGDVVIADAPAKDMTIPAFRLDGQGHTVKLGLFPLLRKTDVNVKNVVFECGGATERILYAIGADERNDFVLRNCVFRNPTEKNTVCARKYGNVVIEDCTIDGNLNQNSIRTEQSNVQVLIYECNGSVAVRNNYIHHCFGIAIDGIGFSANNANRVLIENNRIDMVSNGGIVFAGGEVWNATVRNNSISNTHCLGKQFEGESNGALNSAINIHGFRNAVVEDNRITNCPNSACFDFDGSVSGGKKVEKGTGLVVRRNVCENVGGIALFVIKDVEFKDNVLSNNRDNESPRFLSISGASNVEVSGNKFLLTSKSSSTFYPITLSDIGEVKSGKVKVVDNTMDTNGKIFVFVNREFKGECQIDENEIISPHTTASVVNNSKAKVTIPKSKKIVWYK